MEIQTLSIASPVMLISGHSKKYIVVAFLTVDQKLTTTETEWAILCEEENPSVQFMLHKSRFSLWVEKKVAPQDLAGFFF